MKKFLLIIVFTKYSFILTAQTVTPGSTIYTSDPNKNVGIGTTKPLTDLHVPGKVSFGELVTAADTNRSINLVSKDAVMKIVRIHATSAPAIELISRSTVGGANVAYWDSYAEPSDASFRIRDRQGGGSGIDMFSIAHTSGNVGIGTVSPAVKMHINAGVDKNLFFRPASDFTLGVQGMGIQSVNNANSLNMPLEIEASVLLLNVGTGGSVGIGTTNPGPYKLAVEGKIGAREIKVTLANPWADYVFDKSYQLRSLYNLEKFIQLNKHLPGIPSAEEVKKAGGVELGNMNAKLLEKVEELTLYLIQLKKENDEIKKQLKEIKKTK